MTPTTWQHIQDIFNEALDLPPSDRAAFLDRACAADSKTRNQIDNLLNSYEQADDFLASVGAGAREVLTGPVPAEGERVGVYEVTGVIGHGGMGTVYRASRVDEQFRQDVAIKVLRGGIVQSSELLSRFRAERQILANLTHPNIARLLDGGITRTGLPYLVMEYIEGVSIDAYAEQHALDVPARIQLFRQVCAAAQYAHQNLIVHRDIKPANIMVTKDGTPKLLDFGIAKLLRSDPLAETAPLTAPAERVMTLEYASPEQIRGEAITTATDVYALGILLYELVSGTRPFHAEKLTPATLERLICETVPERPSMAAWNHENKNPEIGPDLDNIILKALHKEPGRRYASAAELSEDLRRYLDGFPVLARPDSWWYRTRKFVSRHRIATAAAACFAISTTALSIGLAIQVKKAEQEATSAKRISDFLVSLFDDLRPEHMQGRTPQVRDILDRGSERISKDLSKDPLVEARLLYILGATYRELGAFDRAEALLSHAEAIRSRELGPDSRQVAETLLVRAAIASDRGDFNRAAQIYQRLLATFTKLDGPKSENALQAVQGLGEVSRMRGDLEEAKRRYMEVVEIYNVTKGPHDVATLSAKNNVIAILANLGDYPAAETMARENLGAEDSVMGRDHPTRSFTLNLLAYVLGRTSQFKEAESTLRSALGTLRKVYGKEHPSIALNLTDLSAVTRELGHYDEAKRLGEEALAMSIRLSGPKSLGTANCQGQLGLTELARGDVQKAHELLQAALETRRALGNANNPDLGDNYDRVGMADLAMNDLAEAHQNIALGLEIRERVYGRTNENVVQDLNHMAKVFKIEGDYKAAEQDYREAIAISDGKFRNGHVRTAEGLVGLGETLVAEGRLSEAKAALTRAIEIRHKLLPTNHPANAEASAALARCNLAIQTGQQHSARFIQQRDE